MKKLLTVIYINNVRLSAFYLSTETALGVYLEEFPAVIGLCNITVEHTVSHDVGCHQQPATDII